MKVIYKQKHYYTNFSKEYKDNKTFWEVSNNPEMITLKPTLGCVANCLHCNPRSKKFDNEHIMSFSEYETLFEDFKRLGVKQVCISGGEPLLYKDINNMVHKLSSLGIAVTLNTNGWLLTKKVLDELINSGLVGVNVSIDSPYPDVHNKLRGLNGLFEKTVGQLKECKESNNDFVLNIRMILSRYTYKDVIGMIELCKSVNADSLSIDMIEADFENKYFLLNQEQILEFRNNYIPQIIDYLNKDDFGAEYKDFNTKQINDIFDLDFNSLENYANGIYWPDDKIKEKCSIPYSFAIIEGDGSVLPCNAVEYNRQRIVGNCVNDNLETVWNSEERKNFCDKKMDFCRMCPMNMSFNLVFNEREVIREIQ